MHGSVCASSLVIYSTVCALMSKHVFVCVVAVCVSICLCVCDVFLSGSPAHRLSALPVCVTNGRSRCSSQFWASLEMPMAPSVAAWAGGTRLSLCLSGGSHGPCSLMRDPALTPTPYSQLPSPYIASILMCNIKH